MSLISPAQVSDGSTAVNAAAINTPINTIANDYNGNITDANIATGAAIGAGKIAGGVTGMFGAWQAFAVTLGGLSIGNGTVVGKSIQFGKTFFYRILITAGSTTTLAGSGAATTFTFPVTAASGYTANQPMGMFTFFDVSGTVAYTGQVYYDTTTLGFLVLSKVSGSNVVGLPFNSDNASVAFGTGDTVSIIGSLEAA